MQQVLPLVLKSGAYYHICSRNAYILSVGMFKWI